MVNLFLHLAGWPHLVWLPPRRPISRTASEYLLPLPSRHG